jgi:hypothetical protein
MRLILIIILVIGVVVAFSDKKNTNEKPIVQMSDQDKAKLWAEQMVLREKECESTLEKYNDLIEKKSFLAAHISIGSCARDFPEKYKSLETAALVPVLINDINNKAESASFRLNQFTRLDALDKSLADKYRYLIPSLNALVKAEELKRIQAIAKQKKSEGVRLGMAPADVEASSWGKPQKINTTTNKWGESQQWVYGNGGYLYFENGVLTSIQN